MTQFEDLQLAIGDGVARIDVARPDKLNAYRDETADALLAALRHVEADSSVRVAILSGQGRAFGAGYDLSTVTPDTIPELEVVLERHFNPLIRHMRASRLPIIAKVNGPCAGAAVGIALAADIVVAAQSAYFYEPFVGIALVPDAGNTIFTTRMLGRGRAAGMMLLGDRISAQQAHDWGLVWAVAADEALDSEVDRIAKVLAARAPSAIAATKQLITAASEADLDGQLGREADLQGIAGRSPEMKQAIADFFASRRQGKAAP